MSTIHATEIDLTYESGVRLKDSYLFMSKKLGSYDNIRFIKQDHKNYLHNKRQNSLRCVEIGSLERFFKTTQRKYFILLCNVVGSEWTNY